jgi:hypothetical protein
MPRKFIGKPPSYTPVYQPPVQPQIVIHKALADMSREEGKTWLEGIQARLVAKQRREKTYLERRAGRGTHTPTDEAYEGDQILEDELLLLLQDLINGC